MHTNEISRIWIYSSVKIVDLKKRRKGKNKIKNNFTAMNYAVASCFLILNRLYRKSIGKYCLQTILNGWTNLPYENGLTLCLSCSFDRFSQTLIRQIFHDNFFFSFLRIFFYRFVSSGHLYAAYHIIHLLYKCTSICISFSIYLALFSVFSVGDAMHKCRMVIGISVLMFLRIQI